MLSFRAINRTCRGVVSLRYPARKTHFKGICIILLFIFMLNCTSYPGAFKTVIDKTCWFLRLLGFKAVGLPVIFVITPTYFRPVQRAELTRLSNTLRLVPAIHWLVVEDSNIRSKNITDILEKSGIRFTHLHYPSLSFAQPWWETRNSTPFKFKCKGVFQRNHAIYWIRRHLMADKSDVVYFADDDNTYSLEIFEEMRYTRGVSVWPVGLAGGLYVEGPIVNRTSGRVIDWISLYARDTRIFPIDMAGFAVSVSLLNKKRGVYFNPFILGGQQENYFLSQLTTVDELEPKADFCTKVYVWHTRTQSVNLKLEKQFKDKFGVNSNELVLV